MGGARATSPRLRASGRPRHGITPSVACANSLAPSISAPAPGLGIEAAEQVGPGVIAPHGGARAARAIGEAADPPHRDAGALRGARGRGCERPRRAIATSPSGPPAGDADIDGVAVDRSRVRTSSPQDSSVFAVCRLVAQRSPVRSGGQSSGSRVRMAPRRNCLRGR